MKRLDPVNKKKLLRETDHLTRPPRLEGKAKNAGMNPIRKRKAAYKNGEKAR